MSTVVLFFGRVGHVLARVGLPRELREAIRSEGLPQPVDTGAGSHG